MAKVDELTSISSPSSSPLTGRHTRHLSLESILLKYLSGELNSPIASSGSSFAARSSSLSIANVIRSIVELCGLAYIAQSTKASRKTDSDWFPKPWSKAFLFGSSAIGGSVAFSDVDVLLLLGATINPQYAPHTPGFFETYNSWSAEAYFSDFPAILERELNGLMADAIRTYGAYMQTTSPYVTLIEHLNELSAHSAVFVTPISSARVPVLRFGFCGVHVDVVMAAYSPPLRWFDSEAEEDRSYPFPRDGQAVFPGEAEGDGSLFMSHVQNQQPVFQTLPRQWQLSKAIDASDLQRTILASTVTGQDHPETQLAKLLLLSNVEESLHVTGTCARSSSNHLMLCSAAWLIYRRVPLVSMRGAINGVRTILLMQLLLPDSAQSEGYTAPASKVSTPALANSAATPSPPFLTARSSFPHSPQVSSKKEAILGAPPSPPPFSFYQDVFMIVLKFIKIWAKRRAIYGNLYGYAPGVSWALLAVRGCQLTPSTYVSVVLRQFFKNIAKLLSSLNPERAPLKVPPLYITKSLFIEDNIVAVPRLAGMMDPWRPTYAANGANSPSNICDALPIISPAYPFSNSAHTASGNGRRIILEEMRLASNFLNSKPFRESGTYKFPVNSLVDLAEIYPPYVFLPHPSFPVTAPTPSSTPQSSYTSPTSVGPSFAQIPLKTVSSPLVTSPPQAPFYNMSSDSDPLCLGGGFDAFLLVDAIVSQRLIKRSQQNPRAFYTKLFGIWAGFVESRIRYLVYSLEALGSEAPKEASESIEAQKPVGIELVRPFPDRIDRKVLIDGNVSEFVNGPLGCHGINNCGTMAIGLRFRIPQLNPDATPAQRCQALKRPEMASAIASLLQPAITDFCFSIDSACTTGKPYHQRKKFFVIGTADTKDQFVRDPMMAGPFCRLVLTSCEGGGDIPLICANNLSNGLLNPFAPSRSALNESIGLKRAREGADDELLDRKASEIENEKLNGIYEAPNPQTEKAAMSLLKKMASPLRGQHSTLLSPNALRSGDGTVARSNQNNNNNESIVNGEVEVEEEARDENNEELIGNEVLTDGSTVEGAAGQGILGDPQARNAINVTSHIAHIHKINYGRKVTPLMAEGIHAPCDVALDYFVYNMYLPQELCQPLV